MQIDLSELKQTIDRLFNHIKDTRGVKFFEFEKENYWNIPSRDVYEFEEPKELENRSDLAGKVQFYRSAVDRKSVV